MSRRVLLNKDGKIKEVSNNTISKIQQLEQKRRDILRMIHQEGNNLTRGIYKTQLIHLDIEIQKYKAEK